MTPARFASGHSLPSAENLFVVSPRSPARPMLWPDGAIDLI